MLNNSDSKCQSAKWKEAECDFGGPMCAFDSNLTKNDIGTIADAGRLHRFCLDSS
jgi:hypothetical protein